MHVGMSRKYSREFKEALVTQILTRGDRTVASVCAEAGVSRKTATTWVRVCGTVSAHPTPRGRMTWTAEAKLKALVETAGLAEEELGLYLRREGLYSHQITAWRAEVIAHFETKPTGAKDARDETIHQLEREILRKDKALAEASALLILQKKVELIWGNGREGVK
jgi:transposase-like protein